MFGFPWCYLGYHSCCKELPISLETIDTLFVQVTQPFSLHSGKIGMCSALEGETGPVHILHPSFADFLMTQWRCNNEALYIDAGLHHPKVAIYIYLAHFGKKF